MSLLTPPVGVDIQTLESSKHLEMKSDTSLKYSWLGCEGYRSATSLLVVKAISLKVMRWVRLGLCWALARYMDVTCLKSKHVHPD
ncbi:hypothetical protein Tco_0382987 [Tanacetum coccineum]